MGEPVVLVVAGAGHGGLQVVEHLFQGGVGAVQGHHGGAQAGLAFAQVGEHPLGGAGGGAGQQQGQVILVVTGDHVAAAQPLADGFGQGVDVRVVDQHQGQRRGQPVVQRDQPAGGAGQGGAADKAGLRVAPGGFHRLPGEHLVAPDHKPEVEHAHGQGGEQEQAGGGGGFGAAGAVADADRHDDGQHHFGGGQHHQKTLQAVQQAVTEHRQEQQRHGRRRLAAVEQNHDAENHQVQAGRQNRRVRHTRHQKQQLQSQVTAGQNPGRGRRHREEETFRMVEVEHRQDGEQGSGQVLKYDYALFRGHTRRSFHEWRCSSKQCGLCCVTSPTE